MVGRILLVALIFSFNSCSDDKKSEQHSPQRFDADSVILSLQTEVKDTLNEEKRTTADTIEIHIFQKGETLWDLSKKYYGNRHYSSILSVYNKIKDVNRIEPGIEIKIPPFTEILTDKDFGLVPPLRKEVFKILAARQLYLELEPSLWELRRASNWKGEQNLPEIIVVNLIKAADLIDLTINQLKAPKENADTIPNRMMNNLKSVSRNLKHLASGANDGFGYDLDMIHQDLIRAIHSGRAWVKENYKSG